MSLGQAGLPLIGRIAAAAAVLGTGIWACVLLDRTAGWLPWLRWVVLVAGLLGAAAVFVTPLLLRRAGGGRRMALLAYSPLVLVMVAGLGGPLAYILDTAGPTHTGSILSGGPTVTGSFGGGRPGGTGGGFGARTGDTGTSTGTGTGSTGTGGTGTGGTAPRAASPVARPPVAAARAAEACPATPPSAVR